MDARGNIYFDENGVPAEDAARLDGYLKAKAEQGERERLEAQIVDIEATKARLAQLERDLRDG